MANGADERPARGRDCGVSPGGRGGGCDLRGTSPPSRSVGLSAEIADGLEVFGWSQWPMTRSPVSQEGPW